MLQIDNTVVLQKQIEKIDKIRSSRNEAKVQEYLEAITERFVLCGAVEITDSQSRQVMPDTWSETWDLRLLSLIFK